MTDGRIVVIELNDIAACGFFADNNLDVLFGELYKLAVSYELGIKWATS